MSDRGVNNIINEGFLCHDVQRHMAIKAQSDRCFHLCFFCKIQGKKAFDYRFSTYNQNTLTQPNFKWFQLTSLCLSLNDLCRCPNRKSWGLRHGGRASSSSYTNTCWDRGRYEYVLYVCWEMCDGSGWGATGASAPVTLSLDPPVAPPNRVSVSIIQWKISCNDFVLKGKAEIIQVSRQFTTQSELLKL